MRAVAYSIKGFEKEFLAKANQKKHDITLISNPLDVNTAVYAEGKEAVIVFTNDDLSAPVIDKLAGLGIRFIATRSVGTDHIDREAASHHQIKIGNVPSYSPEAIAEHTVMLALALSRKLIPTADQVRNFDFRIDGHVGFNFFGKTVGLIGLGHIGRAAAPIFKGLGCRVLGYDMAFPHDLPDVDATDLETLLEQSDVISLHLPLEESTRHFIDECRLSKMKKGVMLLNTGRGALINTEDVLKGLSSGHIGYLGVDVYEFEKGLFFFDHSHNGKQDPLLEALLAFPNVIVTPHQAFLTTEALQNIAAQTIQNLDRWQEDKCLGKACACHKPCRVLTANK